MSSGKLIKDVGLKANNKFRNIALTIGVIGIVIFATGIYLDKGWMYVIGLVLTIISLMVWAYLYVAANSIEVFADVADATAGALNNDRNLYTYGDSNYGSDTYGSCTYGVDTKFGDDFADTSSSDNNTFFF
jgi:hypothetical protein